jgi:hypothetical protein
MNSSALIKIDSWFRPVYLLVKLICRIFNVEDRPPNSQVVLKFFGMGSIVRIAHVIQNSTAKKSINIELVTFKKNRALCQELGINARYIRTEPIGLLVDSLNLFLHCWKRKELGIVDMERSSNLVGIMRELMAIGKHQVSFEQGEANSTKGRMAINIEKQPSTLLIAAALDLDYQYTTGAVKGQTRNNTVLININAGEYIEERRFPLDAFAEIIRGIGEKNPSLKFELTGSDQEKKRVENFIQEYNLSELPIGNVAGEKSLKQFIDSIKKAKLVITNDSSPLHLANHFGTPCAVFWGPTSFKLVGYPSSSIMLNIFSELGCSPCFLHHKSKVAVNCQGRKD